MTEQQIEHALIDKLGDLKYIYRPDIRDRAALEQNFRQHFEALNRVHLTDSEFARLLDGIVTPDVFAAAKHLRERNHFERDDGTPLYYTLVKTKTTGQHPLGHCRPTARRDLITVQSQKLAALKLHKKGLMQQLFPALNEASG